MTFPDAHHILQLQSYLWSWPKSRASVMVGAGMSLNAVPLAGVRSRFPTWRELVRTMFEEMNPPRQLLTQEQLQAQEARFNGMSPLRIASLYEATFDRRQLECLICKKNPDMEFSPGTLHHLLLQLPWVDVFTTNYDTLLERTEIPGRTYQPVTKAEELTTATQPRIIKLHGSFPSKTPYIVSEEDYRTYPRNYAPFVNTVRQSLLENCFVLLGFSGDDPNFLEWTGWIRDELGGNHAPIYLVGPLSIGDAERSLLHDRGVTAIDLSPVFIGEPKKNGLHADSLEWFLECLIAARPSRPEKWPNYGSSTTSPGTTRPLLRRGLDEPEKIGSIAGFDHSLAAIAKVVVRWESERATYPGWLVAPERTRTAVWEETKHWIDSLLASVKDCTTVDRILVYREIIWRLNIVMAPLLQGWMSHFESAFEELADVLADGKAEQIPACSESLRATPDSVVDAVTEIGLALLRDSREGYDSAQWERIKLKLEKITQFNSKFLDAFQYECALWSVWNLDRAAAKQILSRWQPSPNLPIASMWKAGLLAEFDEIVEARALLRAALVEIRRSLRNLGQSIELLSLEGWCTYQILCVETAINLGGSELVRDEFRERWDELKAWDCNPWPLREYFDDVVTDAPPKLRKGEEKVYGFDPGSVSVTRHWSSDLLSRYLPAFACIRLYEQVGIPMRLPMVNTAGSALSNSCRWIAPLTSFWSPALLVRAGKYKEISSQDFLTRTSVAIMDADLARSLHSWCLGILERELTLLSGAIRLGSAQESVLETLPEVISRLAFKLEEPELKKAFSVALRLHGSRGVRSHIRIHRSCTPWFRRLFEAAEGNILLEWLPDLIKAPLFDDVNSVIPQGNAWPDPMRNFPAERGRAAAIAPDVAPATLEKIRSATDCLLRRAASEIGEARFRALDRLGDIFHAKLMERKQSKQFADLLWGDRGLNGLPIRPGLASFSFLHLPCPSDIDVASLVKTHILALPAGGVVTKNSEGRISIKWMSACSPVLFESSLATRPIVLMRGQALGTIEWTAYEAHALLSKVEEWWQRDSSAFAAIEKDSMFPNESLGSIREALKYLGEFLARVVLPNMKDATGEQWQSLLSFIHEVRSHGPFLTLALPYILIHETSQLDFVASAIRKDLTSACADAVGGAAEAIRHWLRLSERKLVSPPPDYLAKKLIQKIAFRERTGIHHCLVHTTCLVVEEPAALSENQMELLIEGLDAWREVTTLGCPSEQDRDFDVPELPELRRLIGELAGALTIWHSLKHPGVPEPESIGLWRDACGADILPEVRRAFAQWEE